MLLISLFSNWVYILRYIFNLVPVEACRSNTVLKVDLFFPLKAHFNAPEATSIYYSFTSMPLCLNQENHEALYFQSNM